MVIEMFNVHYFIYFFICIFVTVGTYYFLKNKSPKFQKKFLFGLLLSSFIVHYLKLFFNPYTKIPWPQRLRKSSFENISATHTILFPWIFLSKNKTLKDYFIMGGIVAGFLPLIVPLEPLEPYFFDGNVYDEMVRSAYSLETIRFYFAHLVMFLVPFLTIKLKLHQITVKKSYKMPIVFLGILFIIYLNELLLGTLNFVDNTKEVFYDPNGRNPSFIFGVRQSVLDKAGFILYFVPKFMRITNNQFWPVIWLVIPLFIFGNIIVLIFDFILDKESTKEYLKNIIRRKKEAY